MTASPAASFLAGVIYAFNPYHFSHFPSQLNLSELEWLPLYLLLLKRALDRKELRWPVLGGICAVACMLTDSIQMIVVVFMSAIVILWQITFARKESGGKDNVFGMVCRLALMLLVFAITSSGYLWQVLQFLKDSRDSLIVNPLAGYNGAIGFSADLARMVTPGGNEAVYLGFVTMALAAWVVCKKEGAVWKRIFLSIFLLGIILSLGPALHLNGLLTRADGSYIMLPFFYLSKLPMFAEVRTPYRFHIMTMLSLSLLAGIGFQSIQNALPRYKTAVPAIFGACLLLIMLEYYSGRKNYDEPVPVPGIYYEMAKDRESYSILQLPLSRWSALKGNGVGKPFDFQYYQVISGKKIFGGAVARTSDKSLRFSNEVLQSIADINELEYSIYKQQLTPNTMQREEVKTLARRLRKTYGQLFETYNTKYILFQYHTAHPDSLSRAFIEEFLQRKVVDEPDDDIPYVKL
jgi:hypothetical protein